MTNGLFIYVSILAYLDPESGFTLISLIFWNTVLFAFILQIYSIISVGFIVLFLIPLYILYLFREIEDKIHFSLKFRNSYTLFCALFRHNYIAKLTKELNYTLSLFIFLIYYIGTPGVMIILYIVLGKYSTIEVKIIGALIFTMVLIVLCSVNLICSMISQSAHKPYITLNTFFY